MSQRPEGDELLPEGVFDELGAARSPEELERFKKKEEKRRRDFRSYEKTAYYRKLKKRFLGEGFLDEPLLEQYLFLEVELSRLRREHQLARKEDENKLIAPVVRLIGKYSEQATKIRSLLQKEVSKGDDVSVLHKREVERAKEFVRKNIGEFVLRCSSCGTVVNTQGLPHWAIRSEPSAEGELSYYVFSPEMWHAYLGGLIPLHQIAFFLRTSVEGVLKTLKDRGGKVPEGIDMEAEERKLKEMQKEYEKI